jgi:Fic/DOC family protein
MQRPPDRKTPTILFARASYEWVARVNQKHKQLAELRLSADEQATLDRWTETEFVYAMLNLGGTQIQREPVSRIVSSPVAGNEGETDRSIAALLESLRMVTAMGRSGGRGAALSPELLLRLHNVPGRAPAFRRSTGDKPGMPAAEHLAAVLESACHWFTAASFAEFHPVEQASLVLLRLIDIQPFEHENERTALVAASLFTLRSELSPIVIKPEMHSAYRNALDEGVRMNTQPMVNVLSKVVEGWLNDAILKTERERLAGKNY